MSDDGKVIISTGLDTSGIAKDAAKASKIISDDLGKSTAKVMSEVEKSVKKAGTAFKSLDGSKIAKELDNVGKSIVNTNNKIELQKKKLAELQKAFSSATDTKSKNTIETQMKNAEIEVARLEKQLDKLNNKKLKLDIDKNALNGLDGEFRSASESATKSLDKIENKAKETGASVKKSLSNIDIGEGISKVGDKISSVGNTLTSHVTLPLVGIGIAAAKVGMDFDSSMSRVSAISGATGEEFTKLKDQALQLGADTAFSSKQAAEGMENLASAGFTTNEIMTAMPGMLSLAASSGESLASSSDIAASAIRGFGLNASDAGHVADVLATNASKTNAQVADTGEALKYVATNAHAAGWSIEETTAAIGDLSNYGIKGSQAGTTLREMLVRLASPSKEAAGDMKTLGFNAFDSQGKMKSLSTIIGDYSKSLQGKTDQQKQDYTATIFGQEAMSGMLALVQGGSGALDDLTNAYKASDGAAKDMATTMQDNSKSAVEQMTGSLETTAIKLEEDFAPVIIQICNEIQDLANAFSNLSPEQQEFYAKTLLAVAAGGPALKLLGGLTSGVGGLITGVTKLATFLAPAAAAETALGAEAGVAATGGIAAFGSALATIAPVVLPVIAALATVGVGIAGVVTYNNLLNKSVATSTDDLSDWEKAVNDCTGGTIKSKEELQKAGLVYKDFGNGVSKEFKSGIEEATKSYHDFEMELTKDNMGDKISVDDQGKLTDSINKMIDGAKSAINKRKGEIQGELSKVFTADGSGIDENEQKVLDISTKGADEKLKKIDSIQSQITDRWNKAIAEHGKLSDADVMIIKNYMQQIQQIRAEVEAKNNAESSFAKNNYAERLNGISAADASKEYTDASNIVKDNFVKLKATYKTGIDDLNDMQTKAKDDLSKAQTDEDKKKAQDDITTIQKQIDDKTKAYKEATDKEQSEIREYLDMLYTKNPSLKNNMNEVTGEMFNTPDKDAQGRKEKLKSEFTELANVTETGMQHIQDANGKWHDIYVTFDEATGNITGTYDTFTGEYGGYSKKFENDVKTTGTKIKAEMEELQKSLSFNGGGVKLDDDNNAINATTNQLITKLDTVIKKADGTKTAIQDINGTKVRLEFDKEGTLTNAQNIEDAINGKFENNPAVVKTKIEVDGSQVSTIDNTIKKLQELPPETKTDITINGEEAQTTAEDAIKKLQEIPPDTNTDIIVNTEDADNKLDTTKGKADEVDTEQPNVNATANTSEADNNLDATKEKAEEVGQENPQVTVTANTSGAESGLSGIINDLKYIAEHPVTAFVNFFGNGVGNKQEKYTGTNTIKTGLSTVDEHGYETANGNNVKMLSNGLAFLVGHHYSGGDGINSHMTTVNEMQNDITNKVNDSFGKIVSTFITALGGQSNLLNAIATNTGETVTNGQKSNTLNEKLANDLVSKMSSSNGTFSSLQNEISTADAAKTKASNMKVEDNYWYSSTKAQLDALEKQIDNTTDEAAKKTLEKEKDTLKDTVDYYKDAAQKEIETCKDNADQQVKIAEAKKDKLTKLAEATTTAIKAQLEEEKTATDKTINDQLTAMETAYNTKVATIESDLKSATSDVDKQISDLEQTTTDTSRETTRAEASNNINKLTALMNNTASKGDKMSYALQIANAKKTMNAQEDAWNIEDEKTALEEEKTLLEERTTAQKDTLEKEYNTQKEAKEKELKETDEYYSKLLETDSLNAQTRYKLLTSNNNDLVTLLNSYAPNWQDAGQSLADSLLTGLNSSKQSVQDAVNEMTNLRGATAQTASNSYYYNEKGEKVGYASGTSYNQIAGLYNVDENNFESTSSGAVAYVTKGAAINNHMATTSYIDSQIASQVASMKASILASRADDMKQVLNSISNNSTNSVTHNDNGFTFHVDKFVNNSNSDVEQIASEMNSLRLRNKTY